MVRETSLEAYQNLKASGKLSTRRQEALDIIFNNNGPMTARMVHDQVPTGKYKSHTAGRLSELVGMGLLKEAFTSPCPITYNNVIWYELTGDFEVKPLRKSATKTQLIKTLQAEVAALKSELNTLKNGAQNG